MTSRCITVNRIAQLFIIKKKKFNQLRERERERDNTTSFLGHYLTDNCTFQTILVHIMERVFRSDFLFIRLLQMRVPQNRPGPTSIRTVLVPARFGSGEKFMHICGTNVRG